MPAKSVGPFISTLLFLIFFVFTNADRDFQRVSLSSWQFVINNFNISLAFFWTKGISLGKAVLVFTSGNWTDYLSIYD